MGPNGMEDYPWYEFLPPLGPNETYIEKPFILKIKLNDSSWNRDGGRLFLRAAGDMMQGQPTINAAKKEQQDKQADNMIGIYFDDSVKDKMFDLIARGQAFMYHNHNTKLIRFPNTENLDLQDRLFQWSSEPEHVDIYSPSTLSSIKTQLLCTLIPRQEQILA